MILSIDGIKDYQYCPMLYHYNHVQKLKPPKTTTIDKFAMHSLKQTFYWYFYKRQDGEYPGLAALKEKFGSLYVYDRTYAETMFMDTRTRARALENKCVKSLIVFYDIFKEDKGVPLLINKEYTLEFGSVKLFGTIPVIRETQYKDVELITFTSDILFNSKAERNVKIEVQRDIDIIASSMAFKKTYGWDIDMHHAYSMYYGDINSCNVDGPLQLNLEKIVNSVARAIKNSIFYPVYNTRCSNCIFKNKCLKEW